MIEEPEDGVVFQKMLRSCGDCSFMRVSLQLGAPFSPEDTTSRLCAHENVVEVRCDRGRIRYNNGEEKRYKTKYPLTITPDIDAECPGFEGDDG